LISPKGIAKFVSFITIISTQQHLLTSHSITWEQLKLNKCFASMYKYLTLLFKCHNFSEYKSTISSQLTTCHTFYMVMRFIFHHIIVQKFLGFWWWQMMKLFASSFCFRLNTVHFSHCSSAQYLPHFCLSKTVQTKQLKPQDTYSNHQRKELLTSLLLNPQVY
jgi:hypothetical protein